MPVQQVFGLGSPAHPYYALDSTDVRPLPSEDSATLREMDTGRVYVWHERRWHFFAGPVAIEESATGLAILSELRKIRRGLELALNTELPDTGE